MTSRTIAELCRRISHGVYVVGVATPGQHNAFTAAWVMQASFKPLLIAVSVNPLHGSYRLMRESGYFNLNVLDGEQMDIARHFGQASRGVDKLAAVAWSKSAHGQPILENALAYMECRLSEEMAAGDHRIVLGQVIGGALLRAEALPLLYYQTGNMDGSEALYPDRFEAASE